MMPEQRPKARGAAQVLDRGCQAVARGAAHGAPIVLSRCTRTNARAEA
jgi:hypothetical protein